MTPMQEMIKKIDAVIVMWKDPSNEMNGEHTLNVLKQDAIELLEKEREQIIDAWDDGLHKGYTSDKGMATDYYDKTFKK